MRRLIICGLLGLLPASALAQEREFERPYWLGRPVIETLGSAQSEAQPDRASFSVTFVEVARSAQDALFAASDRARLATEAIRSRGGERVRITSGTEVEAIHEEYRNREGERMSSERADQVANYAVSVTLQVEVLDMARAANARAAAIAVGPEGIGDLRYSLEDNGAARLRAYRAAVADAHARARAAAEAAGATLGQLLVLQEGQGPCLGGWQQGASRDRNGLVQYAPVTDSAEEIVVTATRRGELRLSAEDIARVQLPADIGPMTVNAQVCAVYAVGP